MDFQNKIKISEFARISGIKRKNLIFYDEIGLLKPEYIHKNGYRYYTYNQLDTAGAISALKEIGMELKEIKKYLSNRSPKKMLSLFEEQDNKIENQIQRLQRIQYMMRSRVLSAKEGINAKLDIIQLIEYEAEPIFIGDVIEHKNENATWEALQEFYNKCEQNSIPYWYPLCCSIPSQNFISKNWGQISFYYYRLPQNQLPFIQYKKPKGLYAVGYGYAEYGDMSKLCEKLHQFITQNEYSFHGNAYAEYLLDEITTGDTKEFLLKLSIPIKSK